MYAYVYQSGTPFPGGIHASRTTWARTPRQLSIEQGKINEARKDQGAVFVIRTNEQNAPLHRECHRHARLGAGTRC